jgi:general secretion pathway protein L
MSILIIQLPARPRLGTEPDGVEKAPATGPREYAYVLSPDGLSQGRQGRCVAAMLPRADSVVAVMAPQDISWHRLTLPKAPASRLRAALAGLLEEAVLDDTDDLHLALSPQAKAGQSCWVAACDHTWLTSQLMALEKAKLRVDRVVPGLAPDEPATAFFHEVEGGDTDPAAEHGAGVLLSWSTSDGVSTWPLQGSLARSLLPEPLPPQTRVLATPPVASPAERWLGHAVTVQTPSEHMLLAARSLWNVLQFELTPRSKGLNSLRDQWRRWMGPQWRPARMGLMALVAVQVLGLNLWAWHQERELKNKQDQLASLLKQAHPQVRVVLDAPVQMQRETDALRLAAGVPGDNDLESLLAAVARAWPDDRLLPAWRYNDQGLSVGLPSAWGPGEREQFLQRLVRSGLQVQDTGDGRVLLMAPAAAGRDAPRG